MTEKGMGTKMKPGEERYDNFLKILQNELVPALGCTEPIAIAYASAKARDILGEFPTRMELVCSGNIIKNVKGVKVPGSHGRKGIEIAAVLGVVGGDAARELEVLEGVSEEEVLRSEQMVADGFCSCILKEGVETLFIVARVWSQNHSAEVTIINRHTLITRIVKDGTVLYEQAAAGSSTQAGNKNLLNVRDILTFAECVKIEDIRDLLERQLQMNTAISEEGLAHAYGAQVGRTLFSCYGQDVNNRARARAAAGSDARMGGCSLPVVINSGSGNQGITVSLPVQEFALEWKLEKEQLYRALVISNLVAVHQKKYIGSLSAYCGAVSAACGSGAAITWMSGGSYEDVADTIVNTIGNVGGIVCDGAKSSCAAKIASAVDAALLAHYMGMAHRCFKPGEGIVKNNVEETIKGMGYIGREGMRDTDTKILNLMIDQVDLDDPTDL